MKSEWWLKANLTSLAVVLCLLQTALGSGEILGSPSTITVHTERVLSGIDIYGGTIGQAIGQFGPATLVSEGKALYGRNYEWKKNSCVLDIFALQDGRITKVEVWGKRCDSRIGETGMGIKLGDNVQKARRLYVKPYFAGYPRSGRPGSDPFCDPPAVLEIAFDNAEIIDHMALVRGAYPCW